MANNYSSPLLTFRVFDDELALPVDPQNTAERFSPTVILKWFTPFITN
jgi:hypothetical protein